jgi:hypothetical protein
MSAEYRLRQGAIQAKSATDLDRPDGVVKRYIAVNGRIYGHAPGKKGTRGWSIHALSDNRLRRMESHRSTG